MDTLLPRLILAIAFFFFGAINGSYLITFWSRYKTGRKIWGTKHCFCFGCGREIQSRYMWPLVSYLLLRGKCRYCSSPIGRSTLLCEITGGLILLPVAFFIPMSPG